MHILLEILFIKITNLVTELIFVKKYTVKWATSKLEHWNFLKNIFCQTLNDLNTAIYTKSTVLLAFDNIYLSFFEVLRPLHTSRFFVVRPPIFWRRQKIGACVAIPDKLKTRFFVGNRDCPCLIQKSRPIENRFVCCGFRQIVGSRAWFDQSRIRILRAKIQDGGSNRWRNCYRTRD